MDCTLRDGAYLLDKRFGVSNIRGITDGLVEAGIDFIEIGFFQNEGFGEGKTVYLNSADAGRFIPDDKKGCLFTVLADYSRYDVSNLDEHSDDSVDAVRECFFKQERFGALDYCRIIKNKGYKLFVQPVDILGYSDAELLSFIDELNRIEPYCLSIVDTFGSMYFEDLRRILELIDHNLIRTCKIGFHSHNNMQMSNALSQEFVRLTAGRREAVVDGTLSGMGRGAGNTPTELIAQYLSVKWHSKYNIDAILDVIDNYMNHIRSLCQWGYSTSYFVAGCYSAHVNNIAFLTKKNSIKNKDMRYILDAIGPQARKRYDYDLLERTYIDYMSANIDDSEQLEKLKTIVNEKCVLILVPGRTAKTYSENIKQYISDNTPIVISVNFLHDRISSDFVYLSNIGRYEYWSLNEEFQKTRKILTSNLSENAKDGDIVISFVRLVKCGFGHMDNSVIMLLRLLDRADACKIAIAGFDGYEYIDGSLNNYYSRDLEISSVMDDNPVKLNQEISDMLEDFRDTRENKCCNIDFITPSRFENIFG